MTIVGPVAKSKSIDRQRPTKTEHIDTIIELNIITIGELENTRAIAGGIISKDVISSTPTI